MNPRHKLRLKLFGNEIAGEGWGALLAFGVALAVIVAIVTMRLT